MGQQTLDTAAHIISSNKPMCIDARSGVMASLMNPAATILPPTRTRIHAPNFLSNLVGFVLKLRNVGVPNHGLLRELSTRLVGSLYSGEGHSRLYEDDAVYALAISFTLQTTSMPGLEVLASKWAPLSAPADGKANSSSISAIPYILPFATRGILAEDIVKRELRDEAKKLLEQFDDWEPKTKVLKDVKFRLEGVRGQLI